MLRLKLETNYENIASSYSIKFENDNNFVSI